MTRHPAPTAQVVGGIDDQVLEHAMRICGDESAVMRLRQAAHQGQARAALGHLISADDDLRPGTPLYSLLTGERVRESWRSDVPPNDDSLWARLELLRGLYVVESAQDPLAELDELTTVADRDLSESVEA